MVFLIWVLVFGFHGVFYLDSKSSRLKLLTHSVFLDWNLELPILKLRKHIEGSPFNTIPTKNPDPVMEVFTKAAMEILVRRTDDKPLQKLFMCVRSELNLDLKNMKQDQAKFWKQHPAVVKT
ncbi:PREDICTED: dnaJ protein ERDJ2A-like isoform X2 [Camelina sativa]|uniref:DnaJ protein ERDJ2A-like isoform X2 n=1 Tax=Camelina sativa TaxID=90675 RepID=A0ABM0UHC2_CAMSA|nr:PREDICTED: dnaJ protein ERDJ2A-like isoform X2 [Camelina sativa]